MKCILLEYPDGSIATRGHFNTDFNTKTSNFLQRHGFAIKDNKKWIVDYDAALQWVMDNLISKQNPDATASIQDIIFPTDKEFRDAWVKSGNKIIEDLNKCKIIQIERVNLAKQKKAKELLEREMMGDDITAEKTQLQGITVNAIENANSIAQIKAAWPNF